MCGYVHPDNRQGGRFHCFECGWDGDADMGLEWNLLSRLDGSKIRLWTPQKQVMAILMEGFRRGKETRDGTPLLAGF